MAMTFDPNDFLPTPRNWLSTTIEYEGRGRAEFSQPDGWVEGPTKISFNEQGNSRITMDVEENQAGELFPWDETGNLFPRPTCTSLTVEALDGVFSATDDKGINYDALFPQLIDLFSVSFYPLTSSFQASGAEGAKYWVLPISNFISDVAPVSPPALDYHPLRFYWPPNIPEELSDEEKVLAAVYAKSENHLITFEYTGGTGFVEYLPDLSERGGKLVQGAGTTRITAAMVGEVGPNPTNNDEEVDRWLKPLDLLSLLTLATGSEVSAPWIELRDAAGRLVRRIHRALRRTRYFEGHHLIGEKLLADGGGLPMGAGRLITKAVSESHEFGESYLRVAIMHLTRSMYEHHPMDEQLAYLCRALDSLCKNHGVGKRNLRKELKDLEQEKAVKEIIDHAKKKVGCLARSAKREGDLDSYRIFNRVASRINDAGNVDAHFGDAVTNLLKKRGFPDATIAEHYYEQAGKEKTWSETLSLYRNDVVHDAYLQFSKKEYDPHEILTIINHLHDVLARLILDLLKYDGGYLPKVSPQTSVPFPADWVKPDTPASRLGYE
jgi:hypothetical protein